MDKYGSEPLSNIDLIKTIAKEMKDRCNIVDTTNMNKYNTIEDIFGNGRGHAILFSKPDGGEIGHWTTLLRRRDGTCIFFDSYGGKLDDEKLMKILAQKYKVI